MPVGTHVEEEDTPEDAADSLGDVAARADSLRRSAVGAHVTSGGCHGDTFGAETHMATSSIPWKENAAWTNTEMTPRKRSRDGRLGTRSAPANGPGSLQY